MAGQWAGSVTGEAVVDPMLILRHRWQGDIPMNKEIGWAGSVSGEALMEERRYEDEVRRRDAAWGRWCERAGA